MDMSELANFLSAYKDPHRPATVGILLEPKRCYNQPPTNPPNTAVSLAYPAVVALGSVKKPMRDSDKATIARTTVVGILLGGNPGLNRETSGIMTALRKINEVLPVDGVVFKELESAGIR